MAVFTTRWFDRWARKQGLNAASLSAGVKGMAAGLYDADLNGGLLKKRIARLAGELMEVDCDAQDWIGVS